MVFDVHFPNGKFKTVDVNVTEIPKVGDTVTTDYRWSELYDGPLVVTAVDIFVAIDAGVRTHFACVWLHEIRR
jgi:hypothetical protein